MTLIAKNDRIVEEEEDLGTFEDEISDENPLWDSSDDERDNNPDDGAEDRAATYEQGRATTGGRIPVAGLRKRPPVITYESVVAILKKSIDGLQ